MQNNKYLKFALAALAGLLLPFAYAPYNYYFLGLVSPALLFFVWHSCTAKQAFWAGYLFGFLLFATGTGWLHISINLFGGVPLAGAYALTFTLVAFLGLYPAVAGMLGRLFCNRSCSVQYLLALPALWTLTEWCRGWFLTGFPWLNLGASQTDFILSRYAPVLGVYGVSFIACVVAGCIVLLGLKQHRRLAYAVIAAVFAGAFLLNSLSWTSEYEGELSAALVQGAIPQAQKWDPAIRNKTYRLYLRLTAPYQDRDVVVWPETALPAFVYEAEEVLDSIRDSVNEFKTVFLTGILSRDTSGERYHNSILLIDDDEHLYHKRHLVPFGEYIPFHSFLAPILSALHIPVSDFSPDSSGGAGFKTSKGILGLSLCYENAFGEEIRRSLPAAEILVNLSNDAWFGDSIAPHQHLQIARMRSIETERFMLRSTNTGISAIIDHKGNIIAQSPQFEPYVLTAGIKRRHGSTPFILFGYRPVVVLCLLIVACNYLQLRRRDRSLTA